MIHYFPMTYISQRELDDLNRLVGPFAVFEPLMRLTPDHMRQKIDQSMLVSVRPHGVDADTLDRAVTAHLAWSQRHQGRIGDLTAIFQSGRWQHDKAGESHVQQLRVLIRQGGAGASADHVDPLLEAALFLCLAHHYDMQQDLLDQELGAVKTLEKEFGQILGESDPDQGPRFSSTSPADPGEHMTVQRLKAWMRLAEPMAAESPVLLTTSSAVWEQIVEPSVESGQASRHRLRLDKSATGAGGHVSPGSLGRLLDILTTSLNPDDIIREKAGAPASAPMDPVLDLCIMPGAAFQSLFSRVSAQNQGDENAGFGSRRVVIAHVALSPEKA